MKKSPPLSAPILLLSGDEDALRRRALHEALEKLNLKSDDFDVSSTDGSVGAETWIGQASTAPFLGERRVVIVRNVLRADPAPHLKAQMAALPETALLLLVADDEQGDDARQQRLKTSKKNWEKLVTESGGRVETFEISPREVLGAIKNEATRLGKKLSDKSAETLAEMTGGNLSRSIEELEKLAIYVGAEEAIREADIKTLVMPSREWNVFKLTDAVVNNQGAEAVRQLRILVESPQKAEEAAFRSILPMLSRQLRLLWQARICVEARTTPTDAPAEVAGLFPAKPNISKEPPYRVGALMRSARQADFTRLSECFSLLSAADSKLKGLLPSYSAFETLEEMTLRMVSLFAPRSA